MLWKHLKSQRLRASRSLLLPCCFPTPRLGSPAEFHMGAVTNPFLGFSCLLLPWLKLGGGAVTRGANSKQTPNSSRLNLSTFWFLFHLYISFENSRNLLLGSLWIPACSLVHLQAVVWGPHDSLPTYITAWLFKSEESCGHPQTHQLFLNVSLTLKAKQWSPRSAPPLRNK